MNTDISVGYLLSMVLFLIENYISCRDYLLNYGVPIPPRFVTDVRSRGQLLELPGGM